MIRLDKPEVRLGVLLEGCPGDVDEFGLVELHGGAVLVERVVLGDLDIV